MTNRERLAAVCNALGGRLEVDSEYSIATQCHETIVNAYIGRACIEVTNCINNANLDAIPISEIQERLCECIVHSIKECIEVMAVEYEM